MGTAIWFPLFLLFGFGKASSGGRNIIPGYGLDLQPGVDLSRDIGINSSISNNVVRSLLVPGYVKPFLDAYQDDIDLAWLDPFIERTNYQCQGHIKEWFLRMLYVFSPQKLESEDVWALHMIDSWGKFPEGFLSGHVNALGDFDECVDIEVKNLIFKGNHNATSKSFEGRYCNTFLSPYSDVRFKYFFDLINNSSFNAIDVISRLRQDGKEAVSPDELWKLISLAFGIKLFPSFGVCFPNSCEQREIEIILMTVFNAVLQPEPDNRTQILWPAVEYCYVGKKEDLDAGDISVIVLLALICAICLAASIVDVAMNRGVEKPPRRGIAYQSLMCFSLYTNIPKWLSTRATADDLGCLHGIRFLSMCWIILSHTWFVIIYIPYWNLVDVKKLQERWSIMTVMNSTVSVDTFFVLSGLLVAYNVLKMLTKTKGRLNIPMFYVHRYLRLTPVYAVLIGVMATLVPYTGRGPYWFIMDRWAQICVDNWWTNMLYVNNFVNTSWLCQGEAWYLANDMQFYAVSPLFLLPIFHFEKIGLALLGVATVLSVICPALLVHYLDTTPTTIATRLGERDVNKWFTDIYIRPYARIQTYFIGMWLGYLLFKTKGKRVRLPLPVVLLFWAMSTATCLVILYGIRHWFDPEYEIPKGLGLVYAALSRFSWGIAIAWIIFACVKGYGGLINDFLSWKAFMPLGRLGYCVFLVSLHLQMILHVSFKQPIGYSDYAMTNFFFAHMVFSYIVGFFFTITIETPFMQLEKIFLEGGGGRGGSGGGGGDRGGGAAAVSGLPTTSTMSKDGSRHGIYYNDAPPGQNGESSKQE